MFLWESLIEDRVRGKKKKVNCEEYFVTKLKIHLVL